VKNALHPNKLSSIDRGEGGICTEVEPEEAGTTVTAYGFQDVHMCADIHMTVGGTFSIYPYTLTHTNSHIHTHIHTCTLSLSLSLSHTHKGPTWKFETQRTS
jgi:hypothetical protein